MSKILLQVAGLKNDLHHERTGRTHCDVLLLLHVVDGDLEPVATRTWVREELCIGVEREVLDLDLVVYCLRHVFVPSNLKEGRESNVESDGSKKIAFYSSLLSCLVLPIVSNFNVFIPLINIFSL